MVRELREQSEWRKHGTMVVRERSRRTVMHEPGVIINPPRKRLVSTCACAAGRALALRHHHVRYLRHYHFNSRTGRKCKAGMQSA